MTSFRAFSERKTQEAESAALSPLVTVDDRSQLFDAVGIGNPWSIGLYDGDFYLPAHGNGAAPLISLVFVQSRDGNTGAENPDDIGGGPVDKHLIYEGLSRVAADAVLAGARTAGGPEIFFSVWHPQLVALRAELGLPRHPAQIVVAGSGCLDVERGLMFNVPGVPVFILANPGGCARLEPALERRRGIELVPIVRDDLTAALQYLRRARGIRRISAIGGRTTASALIDARLVQDLCLTTTVRAAGEPRTPFYVGRRPATLEPIVRKRATDPAYPITVEQLRIGNF